MTSNSKIENGLYSIIEGEGNPAILLHGLGGSLDEWGATSRALVQAGYKTHRVDLPGHGLSERPEQAEEYQSQAIFSRIHGWVADLNLSKPAVLVGHSYGAYLAVRLVRETPGAFDRLILVSPFLYLEQLLPLMKVTIRRPDLAARLFQATPPWAIVRAIKLASAVNNHLGGPSVHQSSLDFSRASPQIVHIAPSLEDQRPGIAQIQLPTLLVWGVKDLTLNPAYFAELSDTFPASRSYAYENCGHTPHLSQPERFQEALLNFIRVGPHPELR